MKYLLVFILTLQFSIIATAGHMMNYPDGPYVTIENDTTIEISFVLTNTVYVFKEYGHNSITFINDIGDFSSHSYTIKMPPLVQSKYKYNEASKLFVFSDIHGEYEYLCELLINNHIVDSNLYWSFGDGHLVIDGDMLDRGDKVTEILWMIYRLEQEAEKAGGKVHYLLGNHEIMPLQNDLRYINKKYQKTAELLDSDSSYSNLFGVNTVLGRWLRSKNVIEVINGILFVHAGISPKMMHNNYSLEFINETIRANIDMPRDSIKADTTLKNLFSSFGPIWYRGYHYDMEKYKQLTMSEVDLLLDYYDVTNIIVGHTVKDSIAVLYDGKIFGVNQDYEIREEIEGLYIENGIFYACDIKGLRRQIHANK